MTVNCMKCHRELKSDHVFCEQCLAEMERYPVKPTVVVQLPVRPNAPSPKKRSRKKLKLKPEEQIRRLKKSLVWAYVVLAVALVAFGITACMLLRILDQQQQPAAQTDETMGKNYTVQTDH